MGTMRAAGAWTCRGEDQRWLDQGRLEEEQAGQNCVLDRYARILTVDILYPPKTNMSPQNGTILKGNFIEPNPSIFRGYVSFQGDIQWWVLFFGVYLWRKGWFYSIEFFRDVVSFTLKICWSLGIYRNVFFGPFRPWESWSSGKPKCVVLLWTLQERPKWYHELATFKTKS